MRIWEVYELARTFKITVNKNQEFDLPIVQVLPEVKDDYAYAVESGASKHVLPLSDSPYVISVDNSKIFENKCIYKIGFPIGLVEDVAKDCEFTLHKINTSSNYSVVETIRLVLPANTFSSS